MPAGDAFVPATLQAPPPAWKGPILGLLSVILWMLIVGINYLRTLSAYHAMNAEAVGYLFGGCLGAFLMGVLVVFIIARVRRKKFPLASKMLGISAISFFFALLALAGSLAKPYGSANPEVNHQIGALLKEAAGNQPHTKDAHWWDDPTRDMFHDLIERNQQYIGEVRALDSSAVKNLYSTDSYAGAAHMQKVIAQLHAMLVVEEKYASVDPILAKLQERIAEVDAPRNEKEGFLEGVKKSMQKSLAPRKELAQSEEDWIQSTIDLYQFTLAHSNDYSIRNGKLYFPDAKPKDEFVSRQHKAIELQHEFLKAKKAFDENRNNGLNQMGLSSSDFTPEQLGKLK